MGWKQAARLSNVAFGEVALQATYAFRLGNTVPASGGKAMVARARRRVSQSKALVAGLLAVLALGVGFLLRSSAEGMELIVPFSLPVGLYQTAVLTGLFGLEVALLWWTGLQALPTYLGSPALTVLETLPVDRPTLRRAALLLYLRLFDLPAIVVLVATPALVGAALGWEAGLATLPASTSAVVFALALSLVTGRFFHRRVQGARGGGGSTVVRWLFLLLWLLPAFGLIAFVSVSPDFFRVVAALSSTHLRPTAEAVALVYPFSLALLPPLVAGGPSALGTPLLVLRLGVGAGALYGGLMAYAAVWLYFALLEATSVPATAAAAGAPSTFRLAPQHPVWAVLVKDLRLASRTPGYAFLVLLPILDAVALGLVSFTAASQSTVTESVALGAVSTAALLATFFGPAFFALEVIAQSYGRTLPLPSRTLALGKVTLIAGVFLAAGGTVLAITAVRIPAPGLFAVFIAAELPAVLAAGFAELTILFRWARARGMPVTSLYAGTWDILVVAVPGVFLALLPLALYVVAGLVAMVVAAIGEFALVTPFALGRGAR